MFTQSAPLSAPPATIRDDRSRKSVNDDNRLHVGICEPIDYISGVPIIEQDNSAKRWAM
jgi:hypothetical protein